MSTIVSSAQVTDIFLKDALAQANSFLYHETVTEGVVTTRSAGAKQQVVTGFVLDSKYFVDLQAYVYAGVRLPQTVAAFNTTYPESVMQEQTALKNDRGLYQVNLPSRISLRMISILNVGVCGRFFGPPSYPSENIARNFRRGPWVQ